MLPLQETRGAPALGVGGSSSRIAFKHEADRMAFLPRWSDI
jgi:hypothetical protein